MSFPHRAAVLLTVVVALPCSATADGRADVPIRLTLAEAIAGAHASAPRLRELRALESAAGASLDIAHGGRLPQVDLSAGYARYSHVPELTGLETRDVHAPWQLLPIEQQACGVLLGRDYPAPIVDHAAARAKTLALFKAVRADAASA